MKFYPKQYQDFYPVRRNEVILEKVGVEGMDRPDIVAKFRSFYRDTYAQLWHFYICQVWLERKLLFNGQKREANGKYALPFAPMNIAFFNLEVGISPCLITNTRLWPVVLSYFKEFYPDFEKHDPFEDPDYYAFPYKHTTLDFLGFVYQVENRREMLDEAEKLEMSLIVFQNWAVNWVLSYNDDVGEEIYSLKLHPDNIWYIKNTKRKKSWRVF